MLKNVHYLASLSIDFSVSLIVLLVTKFSDSQPTCYFLWVPKTKPLKLFWIAVDYLAFFADLSVWKLSLLCSKHK